MSKEWLCICSSYSLVQPLYTPMIVLALPCKKHPGTPNSEADNRLRALISSRWTPNHWPSWGPAMMLALPQLSEASLQSLSLLVLLVLLTHFSGVEEYKPNGEQTRNTKQNSSSKRYGFFVFLFSLSLSLSSSSSTGV